MMSRLLFVDTSAWFAYVNRADPEHQRVRRVLDSFDGSLLISNHVFDETVTLCRRRLGHAIAKAVGETLRDRSLVELVRASAEDESAAWELFCERPDKEYSLTDCSSFVMMRRLEIDVAAAVDEDFRREGFRVSP